MSITERFTRLVRELWSISPFITIILGILAICGIVYVIFDLGGAFVEGNREEQPTTPEEDEERQREEEEYQKKTKATDDMLWALVALNESCKLEEWRGNATCGTCAECELREDEEEDQYYYCPYHGNTSIPDGDFPHYCKDYDGPGRPC